MGRSELCWYACAPLVLGRGRQAHSSVPPASASALTGIRDPFFLPPPFFVFARGDFDTIIPGSVLQGSRRSPAQWQRFHDNEVLRKSLLRSIECERGISCRENGQPCKRLDVVTASSKQWKASCRNAASTPRVAPKAKRAPSSNAKVKATSAVSAVHKRPKPILRLNVSAPRQFRFIPRLDPPPLGEPRCGMPPQERRLACESWCAASPLASFVSTLAAKGLGCWDTAAVPPRPKQRLRLFFTGFNGLADSLTGAVSALYIAALAGAEFHMRFSADPSEARFDWAYDANCFDALSLSLTEWPSSNASNSTTRLSFSFEKDLEHGAPAGMLDVISRGDVRSLWAGKATLMVHTHTGLVNYLLRNPLYAKRLAAAGVTLRNAFAEGYHFLLRPRAAALARYSEAIIALTTGAHFGSIGVHIRVGDLYAFSRSTQSTPGRGNLGVSNASAFFLCAQQAAAGLVRARGFSDDVSDSSAAVRWLVLSDSALLRAEAARHLRFAADIVPLPHNVELAHSRSNRGKPIPGNMGADRSYIAVAGSDCDSFLDGAMEHWLFGLADVYILTQHSGYGRTAALLHDTGGPVFWLPKLPERRRRPVNCDIDESGSAVEGSPNVALLDDVLAARPGVR